jgi:hypothetical protein
MLWKMAAILPDRDDRKMAGKNPSRLIFCLPSFCQPFGSGGQVRISSFGFRISLPLGRAIPIPAASDP